MSWHYLQGQEAASWEGSSLDGAPSALLSLIPTPEKSCSQDKQTDALSDSRYGMTLRRSTAIRGEEALTWFRGDSPVRTYLAPVKERGLTERSLDCGPSLPGSLARCSPPMSGWKTRQCSLFGGLTEFSGTWPRWGMMHDGELLRLATPGHLTGGNESGSWDTPCKADAHPRAYGRKGPWNGPGQKHLQAQAYERMTPECVDGGKLNPAWVEWLMGWPVGWTNLQQSATDRFRQWLSSHGASLPQDFQRLETGQA